MMACSSSCAKMRPALSTASPLISCSAFGRSQRSAGGAARSYARAWSPPSSLRSHRRDRGEHQERQSGGPPSPDRQHLARRPVLPRPAWRCWRPTTPRASAWLHGRSSSMRSSAATISSALAGRSAGFFARHRMMRSSSRLGRSAVRSGCWAGPGSPGCAGSASGAGCRPRRPAGPSAASRPRSRGRRDRRGGRSARRSPSRAPCRPACPVVISVLVLMVSRMDWSWSYLTSPKSSTFMKSYSRPSRQR